MEVGFPDYRKRCVGVWRGVTGAIAGPRSVIAATHVRLLLDRPGPSGRRAVIDWRLSRNPLPSKIAGFAFSIRATRVAGCLAPAKW